MSPMGRVLSHWWRRLVTGSLRRWKGFEGTPSPLVMPGLDPGIHVFGHHRKERRGWGGADPPRRRGAVGEPHPGNDGGGRYTTGFTPGNAVTRSRKAEPRISKLRYWSKEAQAGDSSTTGSARPEASASRAALANATH